MTCQLTFYSNFGLVLQLFKDIAR